MVQRIVDAVCINESDEYKKEMYSLIFETKFLPNTPCLVNAGLSNGNFACFVSKAPEDSWLGMIKNIENFGHVARRGGGCGINFSKIRPQHDFVSGSSHTKACGPIEHMRMVSEVMHSITQSGIRGMAAMSVLDVTHPDIEKFIVCKQRPNALRALLKEDIFGHYDQINGRTHEHANILLDKFISNFNISVLANDSFMELVEADGDLNLEFNTKIYKTLKARKIFNDIVNNAWSNGDPGLLFYTAMNSGPYKYSGQILTATNPCSEQMLPEYGCCNLGSIDVSKYYKESTNDLNWIELEKAIAASIQFLDNTIDINNFPTPDFESWTKNNRPVGLGIMGFADLLLKMGIAYGSKESLTFANKLMEFFKMISHDTSVRLGKIRGTPTACNYPELDYRRNVTTLSIAPTGSISLLAGCSSSTEPVFSPKIYRYDNTGAHEFEHESANESWFRCALDNSGKYTEVTWEEHVRMQAAFQSHCDSGVSKTINMKNSATKEDVFNAYILAWKLGCKGITVYRDGCKTTQVLNDTSKANNKRLAEKRPNELPADIFQIIAEGRSWIVIIGKLHNTPYEIFALPYEDKTVTSTGSIVRKGKKKYSLLNDQRELLVENIGESENDYSKKIDLETRRFSMELRHGIPVEFIIDQIDKSSAIISSFAKAISRIFKKHYITTAILENPICPECKSAPLINQEGCIKCSDANCGYSKCG